MIKLLLLFISFSALSQTNFQYGSKERPEPFDGDASSFSALTYEHIDWRNKDGANWLGPVRNQANCGSCVAFATIATLEDQMTISSGALWKKEAFSQEALFSCGKGTCSSGWTVFSAVLTVERLGVVDVACAPYTAGASGKNPVCANFCDDQAARTLKIQSYTNPKGGAAAVKEALKNGPLVTTMSVRAGFDAYSGGIFKSHIDDAFLGGHAVELVGFNDLERYWIIKNSWGENWGENGYARISYDDAQGVGGSTYGFNVNAVQEGFLSPLEDEYIKGVFQIKGEISAVEIKQAGVLISKRDCSQTCAVDSSELRDGEYTLLAQDSSGRKITRRITIFNQELPTVMTLSKPRSYDYSYPQSGRIFFDISLSGEIFPEAIHMQIKKGPTRVFSRIFRDVYAFNRIGFNTPSLPNGNYEVSFYHQTFEKKSPILVQKIIIKN